jgi:hypothetical protein
MLASPLSRTSPAPLPHLSRTSPAPLPHLSRTSPAPLPRLSQDAVIICGHVGKCLLKNDHPLARLTGSWATTLLRLSDGKELPLGAGGVDLGPGAGAVAWVCADGQHQSAGSCNDLPAMLAAKGCAADGSDCVMRAELFDAAAGAGAVDSHVDLLTTPAQLHLLPAEITATVAAAPAADGSVSVTLSTNATAVLVTLTTGEQGVWSDNAFTLLPGAPQTLVLRTIVGAAPIDAKALAASLRTEHVAMYR